MIPTESISFDPYFLLIVWIGSLVAGLYLGVFRSLIDRIRAGLSTLPADESKSAKLLESLLSQPSHTRPFFTESGFFSALQIVSSFFYIQFLAGGPSSSVNLGLSFLAAFCMERVFSGIIPKFLVTGTAPAVHLKIGFPFVLLSRVLAYPLSLFLEKLEASFNTSANKGVDELPEENEVADHIRTLSREGSNLDPDIAEIVGNTLEMGQLKVQDIMVSRKQVQILDVTDGLEKNLEIARTCGHTRLPLCEGDLDHCLGIIHVKYAFKLLNKDSTDLSLQTITKAPALVSAEDPLPLALRKMMKWKVHMALVGDEFGGIDGVITLEDILEEVVGEIQDEFDADENDIEQVNEDSWKIAGLTPLHELPDEIGINEEDEEVASFGGFITQKFGKIPEIEETLTIGNLEITILEADDTSIGLTEVRLVSQSEEMPQA